MMTVNILARRVRQHEIYDCIFNKLPPNFVDYFESKGLTFQTAELATTTGVLLLPFNRPKDTYDDLILEELLNDSTLPYSP